MCRVDVIETAMRAIAKNDGGAGVDGQTPFVYTRNEEAWNTWRDAVLQELKSKTYKPSPVGRVYIPKADGKLRPLGIPTVKDRVVQAAMMLILMPILEADFHEHSYAYRPGKNARQALQAIEQALLSGRQEIIDADLSGYFDSIPHGKLLKLVARRVSDGTVLGLIRGWLKAPIVERDRDSGKRRVLPNELGTPQGGVISPLLANLYLDRLDKAVNNECDQRAAMVRYADDFVILCPKGRGAELLERLKRWLTARGLKLNETKTRLLDARQAGFKFLGFNLAMRQSSRTGRYFALVQPHAKSCQKMRDGVRALFNHWTLHEPAEEMITRLNRKLKGWAGYFHYGHSTTAFTHLESYVRGRVRRWLWRKHARSRNRYAYYTDEKLHGEYGLWKMPTWAAWKRPKPKAN